MGMVDPRAAASSWAADNPERGDSGPMHRLHPETPALLAGWRRDPARKAVAAPIHQTTSHQFDDTGRAAHRFSLQHAAAARQQAAE